LLPLELASHRVTTIRWRLYAMAGKVVKTGRQLYVKLQDRHRDLLSKVIHSLKEIEPIPI